MTTKLVVDCSTGIVTELELTAEEIAQREVDAAAWAEAEAAREAEAASREEARLSAIAKLAALGLTDSEISSLLS